MECINILQDPKKYKIDVSLFFLILRRENNITGVVLIFHIESEEEAAIADE